MSSPVYRHAKRIARAIVRAPATLLRPSPNSYSAPCASWADAKRNATGFDSPAAFARIRSAALAVKEGRAAYAVGGLSFAKVRYRWPLLACLLRNLAQCGPGRPLHILDFGGSLGVTYYQHKIVLDRMPPFLWSVVELPKFVEAGNAEFADDRLQFFDTADAAARRAPIDVALFSGSLEYVDEPYALLSRIAALGPRALIIDWLHMTGNAADEFRVQRVRPPQLDATLAVRFFSRRGLPKRVEDLEYDLLMQLPEGFYFERRV